MPDRRATRPCSESECGGTQKLWQGFLRRWQWKCSFCGLHEDADDVPTMMPDGPSTSYMSLSAQPVARTITLRDWLLLDVDRNGCPVGLEVIGRYDTVAALFALAAESRWPDDSSAVSNLPGATRVGCSSCAGTGQSLAGPSKCQTCNGKGWFWTAATNHVEVDR